jgi:peroxiredoxin
MIQRAVCLVFLAVGLLGTLPAADPPRRAPGFALPDLDFKMHDLRDYEGKVVVVNVMKTACPHCSVFSKVLADAQKKYGERIKVISIVNPPDNQNTVRQYLAQNQLSTTTLFDCGQVAAAYLQVTPQRPSFSVPHFFVVDPKGFIREDYGYSDSRRELFEGKGIQPILEKYLPRAAVAQAR